LIRDVSISGSDQIRDYKTVILLLLRIALSTMEKEQRLVGSESG
jgi:hypothetical protein